MLQSITLCSCLAQWLPPVSTVHHGGPATVGSTKPKCVLYSQFVSFEGGVMQQVEATVVLLGEVNVGYRNQDLNDITEIFGNGIVERCVTIRVLIGIK